MGENGKGYITVNVRTAGGALPVENALITISDSGGNTVAVMISDSSGGTDIVELSAPSRENSLSPQNESEVSTLYNIDADSEGYYHAVITGIPVFDGITSIQQILLIPIARSSSPLSPNDLTRFSVGNIQTL